MNVRFVHFLPAALALLTSGAAMAQEAHGVPRLLVDRRLQELAVTLVGLDEGTIRYTDGGLPRTEPISEFLAILPARPEPAARREASGAPLPTTVQQVEAGDRPAAGPVLELTDGQRFAGAPSQAEASGDAVVWSHPVLGTLEFKLDQVRRIRLHEGAWLAPERAGAKDDLLILTNGDRLEGFVESVGPVVKFSVGDGKAAARELALDRVQELALANPVAAGSDQGAVAWLRDGSVIACRVIRTTRSGELVLSATLQESEAPDTRAESHPRGAMRLDDLLAISFRTSGSGATLVPLATLPMPAQKPAGERRWSRPATAVEPARAVLGAADIDLPGPMSVTWDLPAGTTRLSAAAELPRQNWTWGDCDVVVLAGDKEIFRQRLNAETPRATIAAAIDPSATRLTVRLEAGPGGPVQDHAVLVRPMLLVERK